MAHETLIAVERTFEAHLKLEWLESSPERAHVRFQVRDALRQPMGIVHGGVYPAVAETVASKITARAVWEEGCYAMGLSNQASFLRPIAQGTVDVVARRRHAGESEWVWDVDCNDEAGRTCALVTVTLAVRPRPQEQQAVERDQRPAYSQ